MAIRWYAGRHVRVSSAYVWPRRGGEAHVARNRATRVTHTHGARVSRVRNEFEGCAGCVRIAMVGHVCTRGSSSLPLGSLSSGAIVAYVENDTFRNCAASLCEGTCRERAQSHAWYTRVNGCRGIRGGKREVEARASINEATLNNRSLISLIIRRDTPFSDQVSCSIRRYSSSPFRFCAPSNQGRAINSFAFFDRMSIKESGDSQRSIVFHFTRRSVFMCLEFALRKIDWR